MVIIPTVNIVEEFYTKLCNMNKELNMQLWVKKNAFNEFRYKQDNIIITTFNTASKCLGDLVEEYYNRKQRLDYFF